MRTALPLIFLLAMTPLAAMAEDKAASSSSPSTMEQAKEAVRDGAKTVDGAVRKGARAVGDGTRKAAKAVGDGTRKAVKSVGEAADKAVDEVRSEK